MVLYPLSRKHKWDRLHVAWHWIAYPGTCALEACWSLWPYLWFLLIHMFFDFPAASPHLSKDTGNFWKFQYSIWFWLLVLKMFTSYCFVDIKSKRILFVIFNYLLFAISCNLEVHSVDLMFQLFWLLHNRKNYWFLIDLNNHKFKLTKIYLYSMT